MPRQCFITGKKTRRVKTSVRSGSPKKRGGVGLKCTGVRKRTQKPNLQKKTLWLGGRAQRVWVSTKALRGLDPASLTAPSKTSRGR